MNKNQSAYYKMIGGLIAFHENAENLPVWSGQAVYAALIAEIKTIKLELEALLSKQMSKTKWVSGKKSKLRETMTELAYQVASRTYAYGLVEGNSDITDEMRLSRTVFGKVKDTEVSGLVDRVITVAKKHIGQLDPFHVNQELLDALEEAKANYISFLVEGKTIVSEVKEATPKMKETFSKWRRKVSTLDNLVNIFANTHPDFVSHYAISRKIRDAATLTMELRARVVDNESGLPVKNVLVHIAGTKIKRKTRKRGVFQVVNLIEGKHEIHLEHPDYEAQVYPVIIVDNVRTEITIRMIPAGKKE